MYTNNKDRKRLELCSHLHKESFPLSWSISCSDDNLEMKTNVKRNPNLHYLSKEFLCGRMKMSWN